MRHFRLNVKHEDSRILSASSTVFLRFALGFSFLSAVADRFGFWGAFGKPHVAWGTFARFVAYTGQLNWFLPKATIPTLATELNSHDPVRRAEATAAVTELAPPFLEDILIDLAKTQFAHSAISALRKADTPKTRAALAQIALGSDDSMLRIEAIQNLGRTKDAAYLPTLFRLMESGNKAIHNAAAVAAGTLGGATAVQRLSAFIDTGDGEARIAGAEGLGNTQTRDAVPILIGLLLNADANVRQAAVSSLFLLTHFAAFDGNKWADISTTESAASVYQRWVRWWGSHGRTCQIHGIADCSSPQPLD